MESMLYSPSSYPHPEMYEDEEGGAPMIIPGNYDGLRATIIAIGVQPRSRRRGSFVGMPPGDVTDDQNRPLENRGRKHSPTGFGWGYGGSGPYALAYSMLYHLFGREIADLYAHDLKWTVIAEIEGGEPFILSYAQIRAWVIDALSNANLEELIAGMYLKNMTPDEQFDNEILAEASAHWRKGRGDHDRTIA